MYAFEAHFDSLFRWVRRVPAVGTEAGRAIKRRGAPRPPAATPTDSSCGSDRLATRCGFCDHANTSACA
ncbi:hypothetical protein FOB31_24185 [Burkholderia multivorans]|nr:hypothetical protein FOB31_24185 [Burkholderia multivorans]QET37355.1 hypothetical protein FOB30_06390 [Burkholderia multivorans]